MTPAVDPACYREGAHADPVDAEDIARLSEGICCDCHVPSVRDGEWTHCPCCGVGWRIDRDWIIARLPIAPGALG